jgi:hypothetical protein
VPFEVGGPEVIRVHGSSRARHPDAAGAGAAGAF